MAMVGCSAACFRSASLDGAQETSRRATAATRTGTVTPGILRFETLENPIIAAPLSSLFLFRAGQGIHVTPAAISVRIVIPAKA
jgi:hypothetical protein